MERVIYDRMAEHDTTHWWYRARRDVLAAVIGRHVMLPARARILEIGCGTGHNLPMLARFGTVDAVEIDPASRALASTRLGRPVSNAALPGLDGIGADYDLIALLDVLEHVDDDRAALGAIGERLSPNGRLLLTVPQYPWMWSGHDVANHHKRRYTRAALRQVLDDAGMKVELLSSFNSLLFPLAVVNRAIGRLRGSTESEDLPPPAPVNALFQSIFAAERFLVGRMPMPPGLSLVAVASPR